MRYILILLGFSLLASCASKQEKERSKISELEKAVYDSASKQMDNQKARELITAYVDYSKAFAEDTVSATYLFKAGDLAVALRQPVEGMDYYRLVYEKFPQHDKAPVGLFLQAFMYENNLKNTQKAKAGYEEFLQKYPNHSLAKDAQFSLQHLGMSDEELIRMFEQQNQQDSLVQ